MDGLLAGLVAAILAGLMIPLGAAVASIEHVRPKWLEEELRHGAIAFSGGILVAAIAFLLVPIGAEEVSPLWAVAAFLAGGCAFYAIDRWAASRSGGHGHFLALVSDYIPEAIAMGALFATEPRSALLLALMLGVQNLPEGFNAYREQRSSAHTGTDTGKSPWPALWTVSALGVIAVVIGHVFLADLPAVLGVLLLFASGGIFYLIFQDIAFEAHMDRAWAPALGAVTGFALGMVGHLLLG